MGACVIKTRCYIRFKYPCTCLRLPTAKAHAFVSVRAFLPLLLVNTRFCLIWESAQLLLYMIKRRIAVALFLEGAKSTYKTIEKFSLWMRLFNYGQRLRCDDICFCVIKRRAYSISVCIIESFMFVLESRNTSSWGEEPSCVHQESFTSKCRGRSSG